MKLLQSFLLALLAVASVACSGNKPFKISGELSDGANTNLYIRYYGNNALNTLVTAARDGKFEAQGNASTPTVARIFDKDFNQLALVYVCNGDEINVTIDKSDPWANKVGGNEVNEALTAFFNENARVLASGNSDKVNELVAGYVKAHPADVASAVLMGFVYDAAADPQEAAELVASLAPEVQLPDLVGQLTIQARRFAGADALGRVGDFRYLEAGKDSVQHFSAADRDVSLLVFSDDHCMRDDSVVPQLKDIYKAVGASRLQIIDLLIVNDTIAMKGLTRRDSAKWIQAWTPGGLLSESLRPLGVPALPYYIVADGSGRQVYRGPSSQAAKAAVEKLAR